MKFDRTMMLVAISIQRNIGVYCQAACSFSVPECFVYKRDCYQPIAFIYKTLGNECDQAYGENLFKTTHMYPKVQARSNGLAGASSCAS